MRHEVERDPLGVKAHQSERRQPPAAQIDNKIVPVCAVEAVKPRRHWVSTPHSTGVHRPVSWLDRFD